MKLISDTIEKDDDRSERRTMRIYIELLIETLTHFCSATTDHIQIVFDELIKLFPTEKWILAVEMNCLAQYSTDSDFNCNLALENYDKALKLWAEFENDNELNANIAIGQINYEIGIIYYFYLEDFRKARESFSLSIRHYRIASEKHLTSCEEIKIYEFLHEMYAMKLALTVKDKDGDSDGKEKEEDRSMLLKYLELHLESMLKCYIINDERIDIIAQQLSEHYDLLDMHDEELKLSKKIMIQQQMQRRLMNY